MLDTIIQPLESLGRYAKFCLGLAASLFAGVPYWAQLRDQLFGLGVASLPVCAFTGFSTGLILAAQSFFQLSDKGLSSVTGLAVGKSMTTELGPVLTAFMITGRVGAAMCAELGTMRVTEQMDALRSMSISPMRYLVAPRLMAILFMMPMLTLMSCLMGMWGGYLISCHYFNMAPADYWEPLASGVYLFDYMSGLFKAFVFAFIVVSVCCYKGMNTRGGAAGVGSSTTNSVVVCYSCILLVNFFLTVLLNSINDLISVA